MTLADYRTTYSWHASLDLAPHLIRLAEQLPDGEAAGLGALLRGLAVEVPASVATDLVTGSMMSLGLTLRTVAALEVIERVYPALDTAEPRAAADMLAVRISTPAFTEQLIGTVTTPTEETSAQEEGSLERPEPATESLPATPDIPSPMPQLPPAQAMVEPVPLQPAPDYTPVPVQPAMPPMPAPTPMSIPVIGTSAPTPGDPTLVPTDRPQ